jgi:hypothetical protein
MKDEGWIRRPATHLCVNGAKSDGQRAEGDAKQETGKRRQETWKANNSADS